MYRVVWCPKYRFRVFEGEIKEEAEECIKSFTEVQKCELPELNVQVDHVHLLVMIPQKVSVSSYVGTVKGRTALGILNKFRKLKQKPFWGNHLWARGYCVDTVGLDAEMIRKYLKYQKKQEEQFETVQSIKLN
ncbi:MAG: IS200/IS605 family transposase [Proteobacteria bacterium]|nr:IS200/IS605 family transposase [Desulfocapsa sp.]MBU3945221.1 IS200/IS605 family transposase [Pseudomonadota bacterium]MBU4028681.1 IS200/IS605 family transposase [Pseudomonadota bacterium]MBU4044182.1 IS200/IS605 family transposase [Pseudomonadota bacterium]MBU4084058.1 IS200/IS605 family transposase [Pseudomonadota bacterium]